jgi:CHASE1-domain containing sensor protein
MLFLIEYDRLRGEIVSMTTYADAQREHVDEARLQLELRLRREATKREIVVMEAANEDALRKTHARYFKSAQALAPSASGIATSGQEARGAQAAMIKPRTEA